MIKSFCLYLDSKIRRLQNPRTGDNQLYRSKPSVDYSYAKSVQGNKQPIVMAENPEKNPLVKRGSYSYALEYKGASGIPRWYICPKAWCPTHEIPILLSEIRDIQIRHKGGRGLCKTGKCPSNKPSLCVNESHKI